MGEAGGRLREVASSGEREDAPEVGLGNRDLVQAFDGLFRGGKCAAVCDRVPCSAV